MRSACQERISFLNQKTSPSQVTRRIATRKEKRRRVVKGLSARRIHARFYGGTHVCSEGLYMKKTCRVTATSTNKAYRGRRPEGVQVRLGNRQSNAKGVPPFGSYCRAVLRVRNYPPRNFRLAPAPVVSVLILSTEIHGYAGLHGSTHMCIPTQRKSNNCQNSQF